jgi:2,5-furandicarboxylate decarboxylase 1
MTTATSGAARQAEAPSPAQTGRPITTLRAWLDHLAARDRLAIMKAGVDLRFEVAAIAKRLDGHKAVLFPHPSGHKIPVVSNLVSDRGWLAEAMGVPPSRLLQTLQKASAEPLPWHEVKAAPAQEVVHNNVDLARLLPIPTHNEHDSGPYITAGLIITRNPRTGVQNVTIMRCQVSAPNRLGVCVLQRHTHFFYETAEQAGKPLSAAIVIGVDPLTLLCSQAIVPIDFDELEIAGALHGKPLDVVKCRTNDVRVPAEAEIVIEGRFLPHVREPEGPFGEFPQYYGERENRHVFEADAVTHRKDPIYHTITGGGLEHLMLGGIPREATLLAHLQRGASQDSSSAYCLFYQRLWRRRVAKRTAFLCRRSPALSQSRVGPKPRRGLGFLSSTSRPVRPLTQTFWKLLSLVRRPAKARIFVSQCSMSWPTG